MSYEEKLIASKQSYPFERWLENGVEFEMDQYTEESCSRAKKIMDDLLGNLIGAGEQATLSERLVLIENAVKSYNVLNQQIEGLIETGEREDLCDVFENIAIAIGINPEDYDGDVTYKWREW
jgi:hypothetical protein